MQYVSQIGGKIVDWVAGKVGEKLGYLTNYKTHINNLKEQTEKLQTARQIVQRQIEVATKNVEQIEPHVQKWVERVDALTSDAKKLLEADGEKANYRCFKGLCINLCARYKFGKEAYEKAGEITKLQEIKFERVSFRTPPPEIVSSSSSKIFSAFNSRKNIVKDIMKALDDNSVNVIGICGMGGVGKTTIVEEVRRQAKEKKLFNEIPMVVVSQNPILTKVQEGIAGKLGLRLEPNDGSEKAQLLWARIKQEKKILVILDDVWSRLELKEVGIPIGEDHTGCKLVLTSRSKDVCSEMNAQKIFPIEVLSEQEAWVLFREMVGESADSSDLNPTAREVAKECGGLPIAIVTIARALKNRSKDVWIDAARQLKKHVPTNIKGMDADVYSRLELSYKYLESQEAKSIFLLCSLFPEDSEISVEVLVQYVTGLRLFQDMDTIEDARVRVCALVSILLSSFLLLEATRYVGYRCVKMHDVIRDVAIYIASKDENKYMVKAGVGLRNWPSSDTTSLDFVGISLMENDIHQFLNGLECPRLQTLLLQNNSPDSELEISTNFFQGMKDVKVLDMSNNKILSLPPSIQLLTTLRTLCLDYCKLGQDISIIGTLKPLESLSIRHSNIQNIPRHFGQLTNLRFLDLRSCDDLKQISSGIISSLCKLEEFYIGHSFTDWAIEEVEKDSRSNASLVELNSLSRLTSLWVSVPNADMLPHDMKFHNLIRFRISLCNNYTDDYEVKDGDSDEDYEDEDGDSDEDYEDDDEDNDLDILHGENTLILTYDKRLSGPIKALVKRTEGLRLKNCRGLKNIMYDLDNGDVFDGLKSLQLRACSEMKYLLDMVDGAPRVAPFRNLEELSIYHLKNFSAICHGQLPAESFGKVRKLSVRICSSISSIVPSNLLSGMQYLETLYAFDCSSLLNVFDLGGLATEGKNTELLSRFEKLELVHLPELLQIWKDPRHFVNIFCNLRSVELYECGKLRQVFPPSLVQGLAQLMELQVQDCSNLEEIFGTHEEEQIDVVVLGKSPSTSTSLQNLTEVHIVHCFRLRNIFSLSIAKGLVQLKRLIIGGCAGMETLVEDDEKGEATVSSSIEKIVFPRLYSVVLQGLCSLTCFCKGRYAVEYPSLEEMVIERCPKMETFGHGDQMTPNLKKVREDYLKNEGTWMGDLNATVQHIFFNQQAKPQEQGAQWAPC